MFYSGLDLAVVLYYDCRQILDIDSLLWVFLQLLASLSIASKQVTDLLIINLYV